MSNAHDLRVVKSLKAIKQAWLTLILKKPYEKISVSDIADEAIVNRKTVYRHFLTIDDIGYGVIDDLANALSERLSELEPENLVGGVMLFYHLLNSPDPAYQKLFFDSGFHSFFKRLESEFLNDDFFDYYYKKLPVPELGDGYFSAMTYIFLRWREADGPKADVDTLAGETADLLLNGIAAKS